MKKEYKLCTRMTMSIGEYLTVNRKIRNEFSSKVRVNETWVSLTDEEASILLLKYGSEIYLKPD